MISSQMSRFSCGVILGVSVGVAMICGTGSFATDSVTGKTRERTESEDDVGERRKRRLARGLQGDFDPDKGRSGNRQTDGDLLVRRRSFVRDLASYLQPLGCPENRSSDRGYPNSEKPALGASGRAVAAWIFSHALKVSPSASLIGCSNVRHTPGGL
jgi:hypothetical protein